MARNHSVLEWGLTHVKKLAWNLFHQKCTNKFLKTDWYFSSFLPKSCLPWFIIPSQVCIFFLFSFIIYNQILSLKYKKYKWMGKKLAKKKIIFALFTANSAKLTSLVQNRFIKNVVNDFYVTWMHVKSIPDANMLWDRPGMIFMWPGCM